MHGKTTLCTRYFRAITMSLNFRYNILDGYGLTYETVPLDFKPLSQTRESSATIRVALVIAGGN